LRGLLLCVLLMAGCATLPPPSRPATESMVGLAMNFHDVTVKYDNLIKQLEQDLKNSLKKRLKDALTPPPIKEQPYNPWLDKLWR
jgi:hypothetical protein